MKHYFSLMALCAMAICTMTFVSCTKDDETENQTVNLPPSEETKDDPTKDDPTKVASTALTVKTNVTEDYLQLYDTKIEAFLGNGSNKELVNTYTVTRANDETTFTFAGGTVGHVEVTSTPKKNIEAIINKTQSYVIPARDGILYTLKRYNQNNELIMQETRGEAKGSTSYNGRQILANLDYFKYYFLINVTDNANSSSAPSTGEYTDPGVEVTEGEKIDLGLSVKWASTNVVTTPQVQIKFSFSYYAWGETSTKDDYTWNTYRYYNQYNGLTKYSPSDGKTRLDLSDDIAHVALGGNWRMPTKAEAAELVNNCTWEWARMDGIPGYKVTGPNGNSIFLPAAGHLEHNTILLYGVPVNWCKYGLYWTSEIMSTTGEYPYQTATIIGFHENEITLTSVNGRYGGCCVRAVCPE